MRPTPWPYLLLALCLLAPSPADAQPLSSTLSGTVVRIGEAHELTVTVTFANTGNSHTGAVSGVIRYPQPLALLNVTAPPGWTARLDAPTHGMENLVLSTAGMGPGSGATATITVGVPATFWPGDPVPVESFIGPVSGAGIWRAITVTVPGAAHIPSASSLLYPASGPQTQLENISVHDVAYDALNRTLLFAGTRSGGIGADFVSTIVIATTDTNGILQGPSADVASSPHVQQSLALAYSGDVNESGQQGGFALVWQQAGEIFARVVATRGLSTSAHVAVGDEASPAAEPEVAYGPAARTFLVAWSSCSTGVDPCRTRGRRLGLNGDPWGPSFDIAPGRVRAVVWNAVTGEFGVLSTSAFTRVAATGAVLSRLPVQLSTVAVNSETGNYVALRVPLTGLQTGTSAVEISRAGAIVSRGPVSPLMDPEAISYNSLSGTFLVYDSSPLRAVELNGHGLPLSTPMAPSGCGTGRIISNPEAPEWWVIGGGCAVRTLSFNGGTDTRLGGCTTPDPFESMGGGHCFNGGWLPPGIDALGVPSPVIVSPSPAPPPSPAPTPSPSPTPTNCATPDPFVALGGGTCSNGGWFPPGMLPPPAPTPGPGGCLTPDPFVALGGGTCWNGGWYPPGMTVPAAGR